MDIKTIRKAFNEGRYKISAHARQRMFEREIYLEDISYALYHGEIIREYPKAKPYPKVDITGFLPNGEEVFITISKPPRSNIIRIVTVYYALERCQK